MTPMTDVQPLVTILPGTRLFPLTDEGAIRWGVLMTDVDGSEEVPVVGTALAARPGSALVDEFLLVRLGGEDYAVLAEAVA